jgi:hypothetical protein
MEKRTQDPAREAMSKKRPLDPREFPLARDARGSARREEIRSKSPVVSAPRQTRRPMERSRPKRRIPDEIGPLSEKTTTKKETTT